MSVRRDALWEYLRGALWVLPTLSVGIALIVGSALSVVDIGPESRLYPVVFQGTADDARTLLIGIAGTMITVVALVLGLTVVALQLSSTQFSPRLLRNFLRDRPNQLVLSVFVATFAYSSAGLYTVGVSAGSRTASFPRLAVTGALVLLLASLGVLVFFAHHLAHSIQIDEIMRVVERNTLGVIRGGLPEGEGQPPPVPEWAATVTATHSGYVQAVHPATLVAAAAQHDAVVVYLPKVGDHVVGGTPLARVWRSPPDSPPATAPIALDDAVRGAIRIGFERTLEQDAAFGLRQLVDVASKALSSAINDPYTAVQAIDHLSVLICVLAPRRLGASTFRSTSAASMVVVPGHQFADYLDLTCAQIRRYGAKEPTVLLALLRLLRNTAIIGGTSPHKAAAIRRQAALILADAEREIVQGADLEPVRAEVLQLLILVEQEPGIEPRREAPLAAQDG